TRPEIALVKGFYERPLVDGGAASPDEGAAFEGGRVTELVARPLLNLLFPELAGLVQPLAGEWAIRRSLFASLHVPSGYAVETTALIDTARTLGIDAIAQVDLGRRAHRHQALRDLGGMAMQIIAAALDRAGLPHRPGDGAPLRQFHPAGGRIEAVDRLVPDLERPPAERYLG
ncbi:MAG TPA: glucosyl-3-phosphoglycerate synthase, partial [Marmoricola sp.]